MNTTDRVYYVYVYMDHMVEGPIWYDGIYRFDNLPIYIGKGKTKRYRQHLTEAYRNKGTYFDTEFYDRLRSIKEISGVDVKPVKIWENLLEEDALHEERKLIRAIGTRWDGGPLYNKQCANIYGWKKSFMGGNSKIYFMNHPYVSESPMFDSLIKLERYCVSIHLNIDHVRDVLKGNRNNCDGWTFSVL